MLRTTSGRVMLRISLQPSRPSKSSRVSSAACNMVPMAPSATTGRWRRVVRKVDSTLADMVGKGTGAAGALAFVIHRGPTGPQLQRWSAPRRRVGRRLGRVTEFEDWPELTAPVLVGAFEGWNDAGDGATSSVEHLELIWDAKPLAAIDPDDYYDFQVNRPTVSLVDGVSRRIEWP